MSAVDAPSLRVAMAHYFKDRGANGSLPPACCLLCGLLRSDEVHDQLNITRQVTKGDSFVSTVAIVWEGPGKRALRRQLC